MTTTPTDTPVAAARLAAEAIRDLNHATLDPDAVDLQVLYETLGALTALAYRLPQCFNQLATALDRRQVATYHGNAAATVHAVHSTLTAATFQTRGIGSLLERAQRFAGELYEQQAEVYERS